MIVTNDIADILIRDCRVFDIAEAYRKGNVKPVKGDRLTAERIVVLPKPQTPGTRWLKDFVEVNLCVPDLGEREANSPRLQELERMAKRYLHKVTGTYDGTRYRYSVDQIDGTMYDEDLKCHYVNVRLLFETINVI